MAQIIIGTLWGDEGKGKVLDVLTENADIVVRSQGGNNAGHTLLTAQGEFKLHLIPSGILHPQVRCMITRGVVIDPSILCREIEELTQRGISVLGRLHVSSMASVIFPFHKELDALREKKQGIGTTKRGIGPCYADRVNRCALRLSDLIDKENFRFKLSRVLEDKNLEIEKLYGHSPLDCEQIYQEYFAYGQKLLPYLVEHLEHDLITEINNHKKVLFEGAQGTFLDLSFGSYPFVTSSSTIASGVLAAAGVPPKNIDSVVGVLKAYATRVGHGPFPTELSDQDVFLQHDQAREYGTTTGRKRRIGWLDLVLIKRSIELNGIDSLALTKLDILDSVKTFKICVAYKKGDVMLKTPPESIEDYDLIEPIYQEFEGWMQPTTMIRSFVDLPKNAKKFIEFIENYCGVCVNLISVGPSRDATFFKQHFLAKKG